MRKDARAVLEVDGTIWMKVFITGVSGYAGFYGALRLAAAGHTVTGLVRHPEQPRLNMLRIQEVRLVTGDVGDVASYRAELETTDVVIHTMLDKRKPQETDRALFAVLEELPARNPRRRFIYTTGCSIFSRRPGHLLAGFLSYVSRRRVIMRQRWSGGGPPW